jgi:hypothetical protein
MKGLALFFFLIFSATISAQDKHIPRITEQDVNNGTYLGFKYVHVIPSNLNQCLLSLSCSDPQVLNRFTDYSLDNALINGLYSKNNRIRMNWKLELESSPLTQYFYRQKVYDPQTMETIMLWCLYEDLNGREIALNKIIRKAKKRHRKDEIKEKKRLKAAYSAYKHSKKEDLQQVDERKIPPKNFEEWIFTY